MFLYFLLGDQNASSLDNRNKWWNLTFYKDFYNNSWFSLKAKGPFVQNGLPYDIIATAW